MPIYEFHCKTCGKDFEVRTSIMERDFVRCSCGEKAILKMSVPHFNNYPVKAVRVNGEEVR